MSTCSNCYNGCTEIVSDRCVKYTGIDVPVLGIQTGDSLSFVEQSLITFLTSTLDGTGVIIDLSPTVICNLVQKYLPTCKDLSIVDVSKALIEAACDLQVQVTANTNAITALNADYTIGCLTGVTASSDTHNIVQAVINKLCSLDASFTSLLASLPNTYVSINSSPGILGINDYIANYINTQSTTLLAQGRMIPYTAVPYFGPLSNYPAVGDGFDINGAGSGYWAKVYLCNGVVAPDLRGRTLVGVTTGMGGGAMNPAVNPGGGNPNYTITTIYGENSVTLGVGQIPNHNHPLSSVSLTDPGHFHSLANGVATNGSTPLSSVNYLSAYNSNSNPSGYFLNGNTTTPDIGKTGNKTTGITATLNIAGEGGGGAHNNVQPSRGCYYIMYIP